MRAFQTDLFADQDPQQFEVMHVTQNCEYVLTADPKLNVNLPARFVRNSLSATSVFVHPPPLKNGAGGIVYSGLSVRE